MPTRLLAGHLKICDGQILWADEDAHELLDYPQGALTDLPFSDLHGLPLDEDGASAAELLVPARGAADSRHFVLHMRDGGSLVVDMRGERMDDRCTLWSFSPAGRSVRAQRLELLARRDALTRLPNRIPQVDELRQRLRLDDGRLLAVCYLDIDRFRDINEQFGPMGGDTILREVARRLKAALPHDAIVARVGGDEFALVVALGSRVQCEDLIQQVLARLAHPYRLQNRSARLHASVGVALMADTEQPTEVMLQHAQHAVFFAKRAGGGQLHFFDASQALDEQEGLALRRDIVEGVARNEFWLAYQPKVDMRCGRVIGFEGLIRWQHPKHGALQPADFIPLVEDHELIEQLGDWAIGEALRQAAAWQVAGVSTSVSVNISPRHMQRPDFIERLAEHLARHPQLHPGVLELEILETTAIKDFATVAVFIEACKVLGVPVAMDDFGTGYSSLTYLRRLPVAALKLDQSFVNGVIDSTEDQAIVRGILLLARGLGRKAIAEGVESVAHGQALMALGCTLGQGYGIARPMEPVLVPAWIAEYERAPLWGRAADCA
ncbi:putative bifunctional diguanylate cyclase/phosphodiesterase [Variovorax boronicumulans]|uniref:putative bifunctional diguanylate cyclase/phosphodiesterase n=1 Tax=Variovorax boronicumulans TaxID=436515 RepID=UPI001C55FAC1